MKIFGSNLDNLMSRTLKPKTGNTKVPVSQSISSTSQKTTLKPATDLDEQRRTLNERILKIEERFDGYRFGKDGIRSIMQEATNERNIETINKKLDELEAGRDIWTSNIMKAVWEREAIFPPSFILVPFLTSPSTQFGSIDNSNKFKVNKQNPDTGVASKSQIGSTTITPSNMQKNSFLNKFFQDH